MRLFKCFRVAWAAYPLPLAVQRPRAALRVPSMSAANMGWRRDHPFHEVPHGRTGPGGIASGDSRSDDPDGGLFGPRSGAAAVLRLLLWIRRDQRLRDLQCVGRAVHLDPE